MIITYTLNFMDKNALSYSANFGLLTDNVSTRAVYLHTDIESCTNNTLSIWLEINTVGHPVLSSTLVCTTVHSL